MKKNIMFLIGQMKSGGAERVIYNLCNNFKDKYNITLVVRTINNADYIPDVNIIEMPRLNNSVFRIDEILRLRKLKKELKIDTCVSFLLKYNVFNYLSKYKEKVIISVRNCMKSVDYNKYKTFLFLYKRIVKKVDLVVNVSESVMIDQFKNFGSKKENNIVIPNFCELDLINELKKEALPKEHAKFFKGNVIISPGRYSDQKGQWHLIRAFQKVLEYDKNAKLVLMGRGDNKAYYETLINELGLQKNVILLDFIENVFQYMYNSKIFVLNSFYEGMPNVLLEAMACELPIIATDAPGGTKEILAPNLNLTTYVKKTSLENYGILIPLCDRVKYSGKEPLTKEEKSLADVIILLLKDKKLYKNYKEASIKRVKDFSKEKILKMWDNIL